MRMSAAFLCGPGSYGLGVATVRLLADAVNNAVVQMEGRRYPGLVVQGDRLKEWKRLAQVGDEKSVSILAGELASAVAWFDDVLRRSGLSED
jgi:hypothetical protein